MKNLALLAVIAFILASCGSSSQGELMGVRDRPNFQDIDLYGMVFVPLGSYTMGVGNEDYYSAQTTTPKTMQMGSFWMDETEITNNEYREFVYWVRDSIVRRKFAESVEEYVISEDEFGQPIEPPLLNWNKKINWKGEDERTALEELYTPVKDRFYNKKELDITRYNYEYFWFDYSDAAKKDYTVTQVLPEQKGTFLANRPKNAGQFIHREVINVYPDTLCWLHDYAYAYNDDMVKNYFSAVAYDNYPVVGVSYKQAKAFCTWRTNYLNNFLLSQDYAEMQDFRLPTEAEWEYAARGGLQGAMYPWGSPYVNTAYGCFLGNYKPKRGDYSSDGSYLPVIVGHYAPNGYGLYDMSGNVAEWCEDAFEASINEYGHDMRQVNTYNAKETDPENLKRKVIRGGSWKDSKQQIQVNTRTYEYQDSSKSYVGFRCVQSYLGRSKEDNMKRASNITF